MANGRNQYTNITSNTTTLVRTGAGVLRRVTCNKAVASQVIAIYDGLTAAGTKIATITEPNPVLANQWSLAYDVCFQTGLTVVTGVSEDLTICWEPL